MDHGGRELESRHAMIFWMFSQMRCGGAACGRGALCSFGIRLNLMVLGDNKLHMLDLDSSRLAGDMFGNSHLASPMDMGFALTTAGTI